MGVDSLDSPSPESTERELGDAPEAHPEQGVDNDAVVTAKRTPCYYAGKRYSLGARLKMPNGKVYRCGKGGKWVPPPKPPA
jgi:hypothetical protein